MKRALTSFLSLIIVLVMLTLAEFSSHSCVVLRPLPRLANFLTPRTASAHGTPRTRVWGNTRSGLYYCPYSKLYGKIKPGVSMAENDALLKGYRPALSEACQ